MSTALSIIDPLSEKKDLTVRVVPAKRYSRVVFLAFLIGILMLNGDLIWAAPLTIVLLIPLIRELRSIFSRRRVYPPIKLLFHRIEFPYPLGSEHYIKARYSEIEAFVVRGQGAFQFITMQINAEVYNFERQCFPSGLDWTVFVHETMTRITEGPQGGKQLASIIKRGLFARSILGTRPKITSLLVMLLSVVFVMETPGLWNRAEEPFLVLGNSGSRVLLGEYYRLFTAGFLHLGLLHFSLNIVALLSLGFIIEAILGRHALIAIYLFSLFSGSLLSTLQNGAVSVGASAAIFGLLGALATIHLRYKTELPAGLKLSRRWWVFILVANTLLAVFSPAIDKFAHIGGFLAGLLITLIATHSLKLNQAKREGSKRLAPLSFCLIMLTAASIGWGGSLIASSEARQTIYLSTLEGMINSETDPARLNQIAWGISISRDITVEELEIADNAISRALRSEYQPEYVDTLATLRSRQGRIDEAIALEKELLRSLPPSELREFVEAQLKHFMQQRDSI